MRKRLFVILALVMVAMNSIVCVAQVDNGSVRHRGASDVFIFFGDEDDYWSNSANWEGNAKPHSPSDVVLIDGVCMLDEDVIVSSLTIVDGKSLTIPTDRILTVSDELISSVATGLIIEDGGQLIHSNNGVMVTVMKEITPYTSLKNGWHLIGSPMAENMNIANVENLTSDEYDLYKYDEPTYYWMNQKKADNSFTELENGKGYLYANDEEVTLKFAGELQDGSASVVIPLDYTTTSKFAGFNLVSNPFAYNVSSYASENVANGCFILNGEGSDLIVSEINDENPLRPAEGFFVKAIDENASITFNSGASRNMMAEQGGTISVELKEDGRLLDRLLVKTDEGQSLEKISFNEQRTRLFVQDNGQELSIVSCAGNEQPFCFKPTTDGIYTLSFNMKNVDFGKLHLIDNKTGRDIDLLATSNYTFEARTTDDASRFRLEYTTNNVARAEDAILRGSAVTMPRLPKHSLTNNQTTTPTYTVSLRTEGLPEGEAAKWTVSVGGGTSTALPVSGIDEGLSIAVKYSGTKKVKSVKRVIDYASMPMTIEATTAGTVKINVGDDQVGMQVSHDGGAKQSLNAGENTFTLSAGGKLQLYGDGDDIDKYDGMTIKGGDAEFIVYGNIMSLINENNYVYANSLKSSAFLDLFYENKKITDASNLILPATDLDSGCYGSMFSRCSNLTKAPTLPASKVEDHAYFNIFSGCEKLSEVICLATDISAGWCTNNWMDDAGDDVDGPKIFYKAANMNDWPLNSKHGIPEGWTVKDYVAEPKGEYLTYDAMNDIWTLAGDMPAEDVELAVTYYPEYTLDNIPDGWTVTADGKTVTVSDGKASIPEKSDVILTPSNTSKKVKSVKRVIDYASMPMTIEATSAGTFKINVGDDQAGMQVSHDGVAKQSLNAGENTFTLSAGSKLQLYGDGDDIDKYDGTTIKGGDAEFIVYGNIMSMVNEEGFVSEGSINASAFRDLFYGNKKITDASNLILPATDLDSGCYGSMFSGCSNLTKAPTLPASKVEDHAYVNMFSGCEKLSEVICLATDISATWCIDEWMDDAGDDVDGPKIFYKAANMNDWPLNSINGIPEGWTVKNYIPEPYGEDLTYDATKNVWTLAGGMPGENVELGVTYYPEFTLDNIPDGWTVTADGKTVTVTNGKATIPEDADVILTPTNASEVKSVELKDE